MNEGEGYTLEYKESVNSLSDSVFETVSSFSNRYGGYILLGVKVFKGRIADEEIRKKYLDFSVAGLFKKGEASPVKVIMKRQR